MSMKEKKRGSISTGCFMALPFSGVLFIPLFTELPPDALSPVSAIPLGIRTGATFFAVPMPKFLAYGKGGPFRMADAVHFSCYFASKESNLGRSKGGFFRDSFNKIVFIRKPYFPLPFPREGRGRFRIETS
jgi:hypothetical protein